MNTGTAVTNYIAFITRRLCAGFVTLVATSALCASAAVCVTPPAGLVGWWSGDGNTTDSAGTNNATLQAGATVAGVGEVGQSFSFNGTTAYVSIPDSPAFHPAVFIYHQISPCPPNPNSARTSS